MKFPYKKVELVANVAVIVVALLLGVAMVKRYVMRGNPTPPLDAKIKPGTTISLPNMDWAKNDRTLLLVLSQGCRFCSASAEFYKRLAQEKTTHGGPRMIAILPQEVGEAKAYLNGLGVAVDEVRQSTLDAMGVTGTPTLIMVDSTGSVTDSWVGKLTADKETQVLGRFISADQPSGKLTP